MLERFNELKQRVIVLSASPGPARSSGSLRARTTERDYPRAVAADMCVRARSVAALPGAPEPVCSSTTESNRPTPSPARCLSSGVLHVMFRLYDLRRWNGSCPRAFALPFEHSPAEWIYLYGSVPDASIQCLALLTFSRNIWFLALFPCFGRDFSWFHQ